MKIHLIDKDNPILHSKAAPVDVKDAEELRALSEALTEGLGMLPNRELAVGLALPQIGISKRGFMLTGALFASRRHQFYFNPEILMSGAAERGKEGCFSLGAGKEYYWVTRDGWIEACYFDRNGELRKVRYNTLAARAFQHELDHLNGILISDIGSAVNTPAAEVEPLEPEKAKEESR